MLFLTFKFSTCRIARTSKCLWFWLHSILWLSSHEYWLSISVLACINPTEGFHSHQACFDESGLIFLKCNHFSGIHLNVHRCTFRHFPVLIFTWQMYPLTVTYKIIASDVVLCQRLVTLFKGVSHEVFANHWKLIGLNVS